MKKILALLLTAAMLLSLCACNGAATQTQIPATTIASSLSPTQEPTATPTPEPTEKPLSEGQQMYFDWLEQSKKQRPDIYGACRAMLAYKNGELEPLMEEGKIKAEDIETLKKYYEFCTTVYGIGDDFISGSYGKRELGDYEFVIAIFRGDTVKYSAYAASPFEEINESFTRIIVNGDYLLLAFPQESREEISKIITVFEDISGKDVSELDQMLRTAELSWKERWYIMEYIVYEDINLKVTYKGKEMSMGNYLAESGLMKEIITEIDENLKKYI